jgi:hypothetical protein
VTEEFSVVHLRELESRLFVVKEKPIEPDQGIRADSVAGRGEERVRA